MQIINISGKAEHGKDTLALIMKEHLNKLNKNVLILHYGDYLKFLCTVLYGWNGKKDTAGRWLLQNFGTNKVRNNFPDYWVEEVGKQVSLHCIVEEPLDYVLIPDCRFPNEIEWWNDNGFNQISVRVHRENHVSGLTQEQRGHLSEISLDNYEFDYAVTAKDMDGLREAGEQLVSIITEDNAFFV